jgi:PAS domain S-box-containing protein
MTVIRGDGSRRVHENHLSVLEDADGEFVGSVGIIRDIEDRKARERELEQYETIIETVPEGVVVTDEETRVVGGNEQAAALVGLAYEELIGTRIDELIADGVVGERANTTPTWSRSCSPRTRTGRRAPTSSLSRRSAATRRGSSARVSHCVRTTTSSAAPSASSATSPSANAASRSSNSSRRSSRPSRRRCS